MVQNGDKDNLFSCKRSIRCGGQLVSLDSPIVMGILNITADSFYDGGMHLKPADWISHTGKMLSEGATIIDVGVSSTRPGAVEISEKEEKEMLLKALCHIVKEFPEAFFSVDTWRAAVAKAALDTGAHIINDISGGIFDPDMIPLVASSKTPYIVMHTLGKPSVMQNNPVYEDVVAEVLAFFGKQIHALVNAGAQDILLDPGFGFGKTISHNYQLLNGLPVLSSLGFPLVVGISRKSMLYKLVNSSPGQALNVTTAAHMQALNGGASILRVHDVKYAIEAIAVWKACIDNP